MTRIIDISPSISSRIGVWPGDQPYSRALNLSISEGANIDLSAITTTVHLGAHVDAPSPYWDGAVGIEARQLDYYYGLCQVIEVRVGRDERIRPRHVVDEIVAPRVLFRTGTFPNPDNWNEDFAALSGELVDWLAGHGVRLVGIDTPSVDLQEDKDLESHKRVYAHDMAILEGIVLDGVAVGTYTLSALPLKLEGADASPVRAVLIAPGEGG